MVCIIPREESLPALDVSIGSLFQGTMDTMMLPWVSVTQGTAFSLFRVTPGRSSTEVGGTMT